MRYTLTYTYTDGEKHSYIFEDDKQLMKKLAEITSAEIDVKIKIKIEIK